MRMRHAAVVAGLALGMMAGTAKAAYIVDVEQVGANVVATGSGSIDITGLGFETRIANTARIGARVGALLVGVGNRVDYYGADLIGPTNFGTGFSRFADSVTGQFAGIQYASSEIFVPAQYQTGTDLGVSSATFNNTTIASLGLTDGTYMYSFPVQDREGTDTFTINITSMSPVPLPASAPMFGAALLALGAVGFGVKRKKAAPAA